MRNQAVQQLPQQALLWVAEAAKHLGVALLNQGHGARPGLAALGREHELHAAAVAVGVGLAQQPLLDQGLRRAAGLRFVQVSQARQGGDGQGTGVPKDTQAAAIAERQACLQGVAPLALQVGELVQQVQAVAELAGQVSWRAVLRVCRGGLGGAGGALAHGGGSTGKKDIVPSFGCVRNQMKAMEWLRAPPLAGPPPARTGPAACTAWSLRGK